MSKPVPFEDLGDSDLLIDRVYLGGSAGHSGDDPIGKLVPVGNQGGFRYKGGRNAPKLIVLYSTLNNPDWPDALDEYTGVFTYYGDNKKSGKALHDTARGGNRILRDLFARDLTSYQERLDTPPILVFTKAHSAGGRSVQFRGLVVPGHVGLNASEDLVAIWKAEDGERYQNYRARFSVLNAGVIQQEWLHQVLNGQPQTAAPGAWTVWRESGNIQALRAEPVSHGRSQQEQLPKTALEWEILHAVYEHFCGEPVGFERCAADLVTMLEPNAEITDITRPSRDGGRDAIGSYLLGPESDRIHVEIAMEAKCYNPGSRTAKPNTSGVRETSRLISRLRHRQFGFFVTTSCIAKQAYSELREDRHPVVVIAGGDIAALLRRRGLKDGPTTREWLTQVYGPAVAPPGPF